VPEAKGVNSRTLKKFTVLSAGYDLFVFFPFIMAIFPIAFSIRCLILKLYKNPLFCRETTELSLGTHESHNQ
jgi:hypothetical protein